MTSSPPSPPPMEIVQGDVPPLSARETFMDTTGKEIRWPTFTMQTAQDDLKVRASMRESTRDQVTEERAKKAKRLQQRYDQKMQKVELFKKYREDLRNKVRDLNVKHAHQRSNLREQIARVRAQGSVVSSVPSVVDGGASADEGMDTLSVLREQMSSALGFQFSKSSIGRRSANKRAQTTGHKGKRARPHSNQKPHSMQQHRTSKNTKYHVPDGSSFYEFTSAPEKVFDSGVQTSSSGVVGSNKGTTNDTRSGNGPLMGSKLGGSNTTSNTASNTVSNTASTTVSGNDDKGRQSGAFTYYGGGGSSLAASVFPLSMASTTRTDAETGETIELNLTASVPVIPQAFNGLFSKSMGDIESRNRHRSTAMTTMAAASSSLGQRQSWTSVPRRRMGVQDQPSQQQHNNTYFEPSGGSSLLPSPYSQPQTLHGTGKKNRRRRPQNSAHSSSTTHSNSVPNVRAQTADPLRSHGSRFNPSDGFLPGPKARRMMASRAKHVSLGSLAPRDMVFPQPTTFWEKEWALHSNQHAVESSVHVSNPIRAAGLKHIGDMRARQMKDIERLIEGEKNREIARQAKELAAANDPIRRKRLYTLSTADRERSRNKILRVAREHELALASRMASLGILR